MAPGIGGPNVDLQPVKSPPFKAEVAVEDLAPRLPHGAGLPQPTIQTGQRPAVAQRFGGLPFVTILTVILAVTLAAIVAGALIMFTNEVRKRAGDISATLRPLFEDSSRARMQTKVPRLVVKAQKAFVNEPLPLGVSINDASGEERVTLAGVAIGTTLSAGTPVGLTSWQMSARDVGNVSVYPPKDFVGIMGAAIDLHSPSDWLMDSQTIWFEWIPNERRVAPPLGP
jgi:hypothetical protein